MNEIINEVSHPFPGTVNKGLVSHLDGTFRFSASEAERPRGDAGGSVLPKGVSRKNVLDAAPMPKKGFLLQLQLWLCWAANRPSSQAPGKELWSFPEKAPDCLFPAEAKLSPSTGPGPGDPHEPRPPSCRGTEDAKPGFPLEKTPFLAEGFVPGTRTGDTPRLGHQRPSLPRLYRERTK